MKALKLSSTLQSTFSGEWGEAPTREGAGIPVVRTINFTNMGAIDLRCLTKRIISERKIDQKRLRVDDVIVEKSGGTTDRPVGRVAMADSAFVGPVVCNNFIQVLRHNDNVLGRYLFHCLRALYLSGRMENLHNKTTGIQNLKLSAFLDVVIPVPDIPDQIKIIHVLDSLLNLIRLKEKQIALSERLAKSRFVEMFGDPVANPYKYEIAKLSEVSTDISAGGDKPTDTESIPSEIYPYPVFANGLENDGLQCYARSYTINQSALTVSARGTIGYTFIRAPFFTPIVRLITVIPNQRVSLIYLKHAIDAMNLIVSGTSQAQLTVPNFKRLEILVPPLSLQTIFAAFIERLDKSEFTIRQSLAQLNTLYRSLLQEYFG